MALNWKKYSESFVPWMSDYYVAGVWHEGEQDWKGKFAATEEELYTHMEDDCDDELEVLLCLQMVDALKWSQIGIERMIKNGRKGS